MNTDNTLNRAYANWIKDGIFEIWMGILLAGVGILRAIIHFAGEKTETYYWFTAVLFLFMLAGAWGGTYLYKALKARLAYPRTGYTVFKRYPHKYKKILVVFIFAGFLGGVLGVLSTQPNENRIGIFVPIVQGIIAAVVFTYGAQRFEVKRFYYLAAISLVIGMVIGVLGVGIVLGISYFYLSLGLMLMAAGAAALVVYLRSHEPVDLNGAG